MNDDVAGPTASDAAVADPTALAEPARKPLTVLAVAAARYWRVTLAFWLLLLAAGAYALVGGLDREGFPAINTPIVFVQAPYFADDPETVDADVALPLSDAIADVDGVLAVDSFAGPNFASIIVEFDSSFSSLDGVAALTGVHEGLVPDGVPVEYNELDAAAFLNEYDLLVAVAGEPGSDVEELEAAAVDLAAALEADADIAVADVQSQFREGQDPATGEPVVRRTAFTRVFEEGDDGFRPAVTIGLDRSETGLDNLEFSDEVSRLLGETELPAGYESRITADFAIDIRQQLASLNSNLLTGLAAVAVVSFLLIGWRTAVVTGLFMITVMATALLLLWAFGQTLNVIALFALILTLGLLVDDAIVIAESLDANRDEGISPLDVVRLAIDRVGTASLAGTLTTVLVFFPLLLVTGILGEFIRVLPLTVIVTLLASFVLSIVLIAGLSGLLLLRGRKMETPITRAEAAMARGMGSLVRLVDRNRPAGIAVGIGSALFSLAVIGAAFMVAGGLSFNIFPPAKDSNTLLVQAEYPPGTTLETSQANADRIDDALLEVLGDDMILASYYFSGAEAANVQISLTSFNDRDTTAAEFGAEIEAALSDLDGARITVDQIDQGPPASDFPFAVQIAADADPEAAMALAEDVSADLAGTSVTLDNGDEVEILETQISTLGQVARTDGERYVEVRARFASDDVSALVGATQDQVEADYPAEDLTARGLPAEALRFDFGQESDNQEDFASAGVAFQFALLGILVLIVVQFRSLLQALLIMLAIPFGLFGVFVALDRSDNPLSFFVIIGLTGLVGVVVNNTILLTDAANQAYRSGEGNVEAMAMAIKRRFRPLVATTATTLVGLAPLAISDPFWEPLAFTIMFGLLSSTVLVIVSFPFYYLAVAPIERWLVAKVFRRGRAAA